MQSLRSEQEIMNDWQAGADRPVVSILCATFNHEHFIADALQGFLIQKTDFPFEILVHDDASSDGTAAIIKDYQERYPAIIRPVLQSENQYSLGRRATQILTALARGRYIAICEGDDFWIDPHKLQIQVDFLEKNPDYAISGHDAMAVDETGTQIKASKLSKRYQRDYSGEELIKGKASILTLSRLYRNVIKEFAPERGMVKNGDTFFISLIGHFGKSKYHADIQSAAYRVHSGGVWSKVSARERLDAQINTHFWLYRYYRRVGEHGYATHYWQKYLYYVFRAASLRHLLRALVIRLIRWGWKYDK